MDCLLKFLIRNLRTIDGKRGTADVLLKSMNDQCIADWKKKLDRTHISESTRQKII